MKFGLLPETTKIAAVCVCVCVRVRVCVCDVAGTSTLTSYKEVAHEARMGRGLVSLSDGVSRKCSNPNPCKITAVVSAALLIKTARAGFFWFSPVAAGYPPFFSFSFFF